MFDFFVFNAMELAFSVTATVLASVVDNSHNNREKYIRRQLYLSDHLNCFFKTKKSNWTWQSKHFSKFPILKATYEPGEYIF